MADWVVKNSNYLSSEAGFISPLCRREEQLSLKLFVVFRISVAKRHNKLIFKATYYQPQHNTRKRDRELEHENFILQYDTDRQRDTYGKRERERERAMPGGSIVCNRKQRPTPTSGSTLLSDWRVVPHASFMWQWKQSCAACYLCCYAGGQPAQNKYRSRFYDLPAKLGMRKTSVTTLLTGISAA